MLLICTVNLIGIFIPSGMNRKVLQSFFSVQTLRREFGWQTDRAAMWGQMHCGSGIDALGDCSVILVTLWCALLSLYLRTEASRRRLKKKYWETARKKTKTNWLQQSCDTIHDPKSCFYQWAKLHYLVPFHIWSLFNCQYSKHSSFIW